MIPWWSHSSVPGIHTHSQHLNSWRRCILTRYTCIRYLEHRKYSYAGYYIDNDVEMYTIVMFLCSVVIMCLLGPYSQTLSTPTINIFKSHKGDESGSLECFFFHLFFTCFSLVTCFTFFHLFFSFFHLFFPLNVFFSTCFFFTINHYKNLTSCGCASPEASESMDPIIMSVVYCLLSLCEFVKVCVVPCLFYRYQTLFYY